MNKLLLFFLFSILITGINAQQTFIISTSGFTFNPSSVNVSTGDIVRFNVGASHPVLQVSKTTWDANGATALPGGFSFPSGTGDYTAGTPGIYYYICSNHISGGMKGTITISGTSGVNETGTKDEIKLFPNPARDFIIFQSTINLSYATVGIVDLSGRYLLTPQKPELTGDQLLLDINNLTKGMYFLVVKSEGRTISRKFIK